MITKFQRRKPPQYFTTLLETLKVLINFFYGDKVPQDETLLKMKSVLQLYASDSTELISRYLWERHRDQVSIKPGDYNLGSITIRCQLLREHLRIEILNARHLKPPDPMSGIFELSNLAFYYNIFYTYIIYMSTMIIVLSQFRT